VAPKAVNLLLKAVCQTSSFLPSAKTAALLAAKLPPAPLITAFGIVRALLPTIAISLGAQFFLCKFNASLAVNH